MHACIIKCSLDANLIDNPARENLSTKSNISIINSSGYLSIENITQEKSEQLAYEFALKAPAKISPLCDYKQRCELMSVALSLSKPRILFSRISHGNYLKQSVTKLKKRTQDSSLDTSNGKLIRVYDVFVGTEISQIALTTNIVIDEEEFLKILIGLLNIIINKNRTCFEENILEAINNYIHALNGNDKEHFFKFLYIALEKAANADTGKEEDEFDSYISKLTGVAKKEVKNLRIFNNRSKHNFRNRKDVEKYNSLLKKLNLYLLSLKKIVDAVIKYRIRKYETYDT